MANTIDFISAVYDQLASQLNVTDSNPSVVMQMEWPGHAPSPADFKRSNAPDGPYDPDVAREAVARLANLEPVLRKTRFENSGFGIEDLYELLVLSAIPVDATPQNLATNPIHKLFLDAQFELSQARRGGQDDPNDFYYPCVATPSNWYDQAASQNWSSIVLKSTDVKPATAATSLFVKSGGLALANQGVWKLRPTAANESTIKANILQDVTKKNQQINQRLKPQGRIPVPKASPLNPGISEATPPPAGPAAMIGAAATPSAVIVDRQNAVRNAAIFNLKYTPINTFTSPTLSVNLQKVDLKPKKPNLSSLVKLNIAKRYVLINLINQQLPTKPPSPASDGFSISYKYCRVNIERPWFKLALLNTKNWWMSGTAVGEYSTGTVENNPGMFPLLPTSFIAIRDLKITANWSQADRQNLADAASLGFFDVRDSTLNANTLESKGMQIIAWISKLMPLLPPLPPPHG